MVAKVLGFVIWAQGKAEVLGHPRTNFLRDFTDFADGRRVDLISPKSTTLIFYK